MRLRAIPSATLFFHTLYDACAEVVLEGRDGPHSKPGCPVQLFPLRPGSFLARDKDHYVAVQELRRRAACVSHRGKNRVNTDHAAVSRHALMTISQKLNAPLVVPIMDDVFHYIILRGRNGLEHVSPDIFQPGRHSRVVLRKALLRDWDQVWYV